MKGKQSGEEEKAAYIHDLIRSLQTGDWGNSSNEGGEGACKGQNEMQSKHSKLIN